MFTTMTSQERSKSQIDPTFRQALPVENMINSLDSQKTCANKSCKFEICFTPNDLMGELNSIIKTDKQPPKV